MNSALLSATNAYQNSLRMLQEAKANASGGADEAASSSGGSFANLLGNALKDAANTQYKAENMEMQSMTGKAELTDLITAVSNAELTLNTVVAVRDKVISAYQDIIRMPI